MLVLLSSKLVIVYNWNIIWTDKEQKFDKKIYNARNSFMTVNLNSGLCKIKIIFLSEKTHCKGQ